MNRIIRLEKELLIDQTQVHEPYLRLLLTLIGKPVVAGSAWIAVNEKDAARFDWNPSTMPASSSSAAA